MSRLIEVVYSVNPALYHSERHTFLGALHHIVNGYALCAPCRIDLTSLIAKKAKNPHMACIARDLLHYGGLNDRR